jgi:hypothetical protein
MRTITLTPDDAFNDVTLFYPIIDTSSTILNISQSFIPTQIHMIKSMFAIIDATDDFAIKCLNHAKVAINCGFYDLGAYLCGHNRIFSIDKEKLCDIIELHSYEKATLSLYKLPHDFSMIDELLYDFDKLQQVDENLKNDILKRIENEDINYIDIVNMLQSTSIADNCNKTTNKKCKQFNSISNVD